MLNFVPKVHEGKNKDLAKKNNNAEGGNKDENKDENPKKGRFIKSLVLINLNSQTMVSLFHYPYITTFTGSTVATYFTIYTVFYNNMYFINYVVLIYVTCHCRIHILPLTSDLTVNVTKIRVRQMELT